ncbi:uncharacterized [Tachysurus ichikawai]
MNTSTGLYINCSPSEDAQAVIEPKENGVNVASLKRRCSDCACRLSILKCVKLLNRSCGTEKLRDAQRRSWSE